MDDFIMAEDFELWYVIYDGPFIPTKNLRNPLVAIPKTMKEFNDANKNTIKKNFRAKKILARGIGFDEYNRIPACQSAKEIWEALQTAHKGTTQVKQSKIDMLTTEYKLFRMKYDDSIQEMNTRFTSIINELHSIGETIPRNEPIRKILSVLPNSWESKVNVITEAKDWQELTIDELVGNLKIYEMKKKKDGERRGTKRKKNLVLKIESNNSCGEDGGDLSSESREDDKPGNSFIMEVESEVTEYDLIFSLMAYSGNEDDDDDEINFLDVQRNLKSYSPEKLISLSNVLIDAYHNLISDKNALTIELREAE
uniref:Uncharacterized protein LOC104231560 n=1 Tax=Nicotiana sylvestris TaxID=4096 RepID=A0A1U7WZN6_NICSY|nr:PREDICTED: uncharacterized protein LOC104231560 [Nicotiana sylvestris]